MDNCKKDEKEIKLSSLSRTPTYTSGGTISPARPCCFPIINCTLSLHRHIRNSRWLPNGLITSLLAAATGSQPPSTQSTFSHFNFFSCNQ